MTLLTQAKETPLDLSSNTSTPESVASMADVGTLEAPGTPAGIYSGPHYTPSPLPSGDNLKRSYAEYSADSPTDTEDSVSSSEAPSFDPDKHLVFKDSIPTTLTMEEIGLPASNGVSPVAVSEPFPLFSEEAINIMRGEFLADEVLEKYSWTSDIAPKQLRGYAHKHGKFATEAWKHPKTLEIMSKIAGIDLVPVIDYEIGHINIAVPGKVQEKKEGEMIAEDDNMPVVGWHRDSYPFVCVLMMSDTTGMLGGETALRTGSGEIMKVRGPSKGCAAMLQGRYIEHQALRAFGSQERITSVTSFRPRDPLIRDDTVLNTVRPISHLPDLYSQVEEYQLEGMKALIDARLNELRKDQDVGAYNCKKFKSFTTEAIRRLEHLDHEIVDEEHVKKGSVGEAFEAEKAAESSRASAKPSV